MPTLPIKANIQNTDVPDTDDERYTQAATAVAVAWGSVLSRRVACKTNRVAVARKIVKPNVRTATARQQHHDARSEKSLVLRAVRRAHVVPGRETFCRSHDVLFEIR